MPKDGFICRYLWRHIFVLAVRAYAAIHPYQIEGIDQAPLPHNDGLLELDIKTLAGWDRHCSYSPNQGLDTQIAGLELVHYCPSSDGAPYRANAV